MRVLMTNDHQKTVLSQYFYDLQKRVIQQLEGIEKEFDTQSHHQFELKSWKRSDASMPQGEGGGGTMAVMRGGVFEKVGVNVSTVYGQFTPEFAHNIPGSAEDPRFWASGTSFVVHPRNPFVPTAHMNVRHIVTTQSWFGGGGDLTPTFAFDEDTAFFHSALKQACDQHGPTDYQDFKKWCDEYFFLPHRNEARGVGGVFFDNLNTHNFDHDFAFIQHVASAFFDAYGAIVRKHMHMPWGEAEKETQLIKRGRYAEFNLLYDRGTLFGLKTGGNTEAILMSLPPEARWP
jgi:coproporphyrinogen III oxidase